MTTILRESMVPVSFPRRLRAERLVGSPDRTGYPVRTRSGPGGSRTQTALRRFYRYRDSSAGVGQEIGRRGPPGPVVWLVPPRPGRAGASATRVQHVRGVQTGWATPLLHVRAARIAVQA